MNGSPEKCPVPECPWTTELPANYTLLLSRAMVDPRAAQELADLEQVWLEHAQTHTQEELLVGLAYAAAELRQVLRDAGTGDR